MEPEHKCSIQYNVVFGIFFIGIIATNMDYPNKKEVPRRKNL